MNKCIDKLEKLQATIFLKSAYSYMVSFVITKPRVGEKNFRHKAGGIGFFLFNTLVVKNYFKIYNSYFKI